MHIAVCDDNREYLSGFMKQLERVTLPEDTVYSFSDGYSLLCSSSKGYIYDVTFLDIQMPGLSGIETLRSIRKLSPDAVVVMLTRFSEYSLEAYEYHPFHYLLKPPNMQKIKNILDEVRLMLPLPEALLVNTRQEAYRIPLRCVIYIEAHVRKIEVVSTRGRFSYYQQIGILSEWLNEHGCFQIHRSLIINCDHIKRIDKKTSEVVMSDQTRLPVAEGRMAAFLTYYARRMTVL
ncbi:LytTR family DNA-binding domain-containing protein [Oscillospiraceae bacterium OttesenSCG-928-G22]|nr:LytTR family DNA-binding domain-containing protein [Oscillospiraceae bacterium OttesenSCG-928-G22]